MQLKFRKQLFAASVLGHGLGALGNSMLGQFSREKETNSGLNFPAGNCMLLVVVRQTGCFGGNSLEYVVHEGVHDTHGLARNPGLRMNLLEYFVNVYGVTFLPNLSLSPLVSSRRFGFDNSTPVAFLGCNFPRHEAKIRPSFRHYPQKLPN